MSGGMCVWGVVSQVWGCGGGFHLSIPLDPYVEEEDTKPS